MVLCLTAKFHNNYDNPMFVCAGMQTYHVTVMLVLLEVLEKLGEEIKNLAASEIFSVVHIGEFCPHMPDSACCADVLFALWHL